MGLHITFIFIFFLSLNVIAKSPKVKPTKPVAAKKTEFQTIQIPQKDLLQALQIEMPKKLCDSKSKLNKCYKVTQKKCLEVAQKSIQGCEKKTKQARTISSVEAIHLGESMGLCVGQQMRSSLKHVKKKNCD